MISKYLRPLGHIVHRRTLPVLIPLVAVYAYLIFLYWHLPTMSTFDAPGHIAAITNAATFWPAWHHWQPQEMLGWSQELYYPPAVHWLSAGLHVLTGITVQYALKLLVSLSLATLPITIWLYARSLKLSTPWRLPLVAVITACLLILPNYLGSNITGLFQIGLIPNFVSLPFVFLFWTIVEHIVQRPTWRRSLLGGLLLAAIVWTHLVAAIIAVLYIVVAFGSALIRKQRTAALALAGSFTLSTLISAPFWLGMLQLSGTTIGEASVIASFLSLNAITIMVLGAGLIYLFRKRVSLTPLLTAGLLAVLGLADSLLARHNPQSSMLLRLNAYRWQTFTFVLVIVTGFLVISRIMALRKYSLSTYLISTGAALVLLGAIGIKNPAHFGYAKVTIYQTASIQGRFVSTMRLAQVYPAPYTAQFALVDHDKTASWAGGVFVESGPNASFVKSLERSMRPEAYVNEPTIFEPEDVIVDSARVETLLNLFDVRAILSFDNTPSDTIGTMRRTTGTEYYHLARRAPVAFAEVPTLPLRAVTSGYKASVLAWWRQSGSVTYLPYNAEQGSTPSSSASSAVNVTSSQPSAETIDLTIDSSRDVPVLIKESYAAGWTATDSNGSLVKIYQAAPSLMLISAHGRIHLHYH